MASGSTTNVVEAGVVSDRFVVRSLAKTDFAKGYPDLLCQLTTVGPIQQLDFDRTFDALAAAGNYHVVVIEDRESDRVVATATLLIETKFVHECGKVGHVEDVVTDAGYRGQRLGVRVVEHCRELARSSGCYKVILDCKPELEAFYQKMGFERRQVQMSRYF